MSNPFSVHLFSLIFQLPWCSFPVYVLGDHILVMSLLCVSKLAGTRIGAFIVTAWDRTFTYCRNDTCEFVYRYLVVYATLGLSPHPPSGPFCVDSFPVLGSLHLNGIYQLFINDADEGTHGVEEMRQTVKFLAYKYRVLSSVPRTCIKR